MSVLQWFSNPMNDIATVAVVMSAVGLHYMMSVDRKLEAMLIELAAFMNRESEPAKTDTPIPETKR
jgi:hypothetical protein